MDLSDRRQPRAQRPTSEATPFRLSDGSTDNPREPVADPGETDPSLPMERAERERIIQDALDSLAVDHRAVVVMKEFDGLQYEEIGELLGIPVGTVRSRLHRARCELTRQAPRARR